LALLGLHACGHIDIWNPGFPRDFARGLPQKKLSFKDFKIQSYEKLIKKLDSELRKLRELELLSE
jgi:hypothetical protein